MAFAAGAVITSEGKAIEAARMVANTQVVPSFMGFGTGATGAARTAAVGDVALSTQSGSRISSTVTNTTTSVTGDTFTAVATYTAAGSVSIDEIGLFDAASGTDKMFVSVTLTPVGLAATDTLQYTINVQYT